MVRLPARPLAGIGVVSLALLGFVILLAYPNLPSIEALNEVTAEDPVARLHRRRLLIGSSAKTPFGRQHRGVPSLMKTGHPRGRDERFTSIRGRLHGVLRAAYSNW